jgi:hypothetical protein
MEPTQTKTVEEIFYARQARLVAGGYLPGYKIKFVDDPRWYLFGNNGMEQPNEGDTIEATFTTTNDDSVLFSSWELSD